MTTKQLRQSSPPQQERALDLIDSLPWGDMRDWIRDLESALRRALEATADDYQRWEDSESKADYVEPDFMSADLVAQMSDEERRAWIAALIRVLAQAYGWWAGQSSSPSPAKLLHGLDELLDETIEEQDR
jgi:hypothetical protein